MMRSLRNNLFNGGEKSQLISKFSEQN